MEALLDGRRDFVFSNLVDLQTLRGELARDLEELGRSNQVMAATMLISEAATNAYEKKDGESDVKVAFAIFPESGVYIETRNTISVERAQVVSFYREEEELFVSFNRSNSDKATDGHGMGVKFMQAFSERLRHAPVGFDEGGVFGQPLIETRIDCSWSSLNRFNESGDALFEVWGE